MSAALLTVLAFLASHVLPGLLVAVAIYLAVVHYHVIQRLHALEESIIEHARNETDHLFAKVEDEASSMALDIDDTVHNALEVLKQLVAPPTPTVTAQPLPPQTITAATKPVNDQ